MKKNSSKAFIFLLLLLAATSCNKYISEAMKRFEVNDSENELYTRFRYKPIQGLGYEEGVHRRDPSSIIKVDSLYYVWYTHCLDHRYTWLNADIWYATSKDGVKWEEQGVAVPRGDKGSWDDFSVFTPNILVAKGKYYLTYQARTFNHQLNVVAMAWAPTPNGPWTKLKKPILTTTPDGKLKDDQRPGPTMVLKGNALEKGSWDSGAVHDPGITVFKGKYYLYYKGHAIGDLMHADSKIGVAIADKPEGPYIKSKYNPVLNSGHEVWMFPWKQGLAAIVDWAGPEKGTVQYSDNGIDFKVMSTLEDIPPAGGAYIADKFSDSGNGQGFNWGLCHYGRSRWAFLVRFECDLKQGDTKRIDWKQFRHYSTIRDVDLFPQKFGVSTEILQAKNR